MVTKLVCLTVFRKLKEKEERRKQRKLAKKEGEDFVHKDSVKFGEVVQQPPSLTSKPRVKVEPPTLNDTRTH
jgi:hypothetical protein